jgi:branched-chain amino acid transport system permease protein
VLQLLLNGLANGAVYALVAVGFVLVFNSVGLLNFAQGELLMAGAMFSVVVATRGGVHPLPTLLIVIVACSVLGWLFQQTTYYPLRNKPLLTGIIATIAVGIILRNLALTTIGAGPYQVESLVPTDPVRVVGLVILPHQVFIVVVTGAVLVALQLFFNRTNFGRMMRATAQDQEAARIIGVPVRRTIASTFMLSAVLAGVAGFLITPLFFASPEMGLPILLKAFAAAVIGGFGSLAGAVVAGLLLGVTEIFAAAYVSSEYQDAVAFALLILFLYVRPEGIFGERIRERV